MEFLSAHFGLSIRRSCRLIDLRRSSWSYKAKAQIDETALRARMKELAQQKRRWGCPQIHRVLRREGLVINHKRTERIYNEEGLSLRTKKRKKKVAGLRVQLPVAQRVNQRWSMDFISNALSVGRRFRVLTIVDNYSRESLALEVDLSIGGSRVVRVLERLKLERGVPGVYHD